VGAERRPAGRRTSPPRVARARAVAFVLAFGGCIRWESAESDVPLCERLACAACATHTNCAWCPARRACVDLSATAPECPGGSHTDPARCAPEENGPPDAGGDGSDGSDGSDAVRPDERVSFPALRFAHFAPPYGAIELCVRARTSPAPGFGLASRAGHEGGLDAGSYTRHVRLDGAGAYSVSAHAFAQRCSAASAVVSLDVTVPAQGGLTVVLAAGPSPSRPLALLALTDDAVEPPAGRLRLRVFNAVRHAAGAPVGVRVLGGSEWVATPAPTGAFGAVSEADRAGFGVRDALSASDVLELRTSAGRIAQVPLDGRLTRGAWTLVLLGDAPIGPGRAVSVLCIDERRAVGDAREGRVALGPGELLPGAP